jgi:murein L,D-transpeptidase YafK
LRPRLHTAAVFAAALLLQGTAAQGQLARELGLLPPDPVEARAPVLPTESGFALAQLRNERVLDARITTRFQIKRMFHEKGIRYPAAEIFVRIFKRERALELWVRSEGSDRFELLKTYPICALAGELGPKRRQGDSQVPEGFYSVDFFNPQSDYHLSLHINYPNQHDRSNGAQGLNLGGDIYIHGGCNSDGCLAVTDDGIKELYWIAVEARAVGQQRIPVHIFPARLDDRDMTTLKRAFADRPALTAFWESLQPGYAFFEEHRRLPVVVVDAGGKYRVNGAAVAGPAPLGTPAGGSAADAAAATVAPPARTTAPAPAPAAPGARRPLGTSVGGG